MNRSRTDYVNLGGLNRENRRFNRQKGVVEYADLTHLYRSRENRVHKLRLDVNEKAFHARSSEITQFAEDAVLSKEKNPFRPGR